MKTQLWELQAIELEILKNPTQDRVKEIFYNEFFNFKRGKYKPIRLKDKAGYYVIAQEENFKHIFFKGDKFQFERAKRVYFIKETLLNSVHIIQDKDNIKRYHYLQPYKVNGVLESFCVITKRADLLSWIVTAFSIPWDRVVDILKRK